VPRLRAADARGSLLMKDRYRENMSMLCVQLMLMPMLAPPPTLHAMLMPGDAMIHIIPSDA